MTTLGTATAPGRPHPTIQADTFVRRCMDVAVALTLMTVLFPLMLLIALLIVHDSPGPAIYRQQRVGRGGQSFTIWKFRTMSASADRTGPAVASGSDPRITPLGRRLRHNRLDELPQLINLLRGDMTLIGPRPEVPRFLAYYTTAERQLLRVRPGILGPGALLFALRQCDELATAADPEAFYTAHHLHPKLALDLTYLTQRRLRADVALIHAALTTVATGR